MVFRYNVSEHPFLTLDKNKQQEVLNKSTKISGGVKNILTSASPNEQLAILRENPDLRRLLHDLSGPAPSRSLRQLRHDLRFLIPPPTTIDTIRRTKKTLFW